MEQTKLLPIAVLGAGSWGTALALSLARRSQHVKIWSVDQTEIQAMLRDGSNERYLPGIPLPPSLQPVLELKEAMQGCQDILMAVPSVGFRSTLTSLQPFFSRPQRIICASKGLDEPSGNLLYHVAQEILGDNVDFAVLSGPSFAKEVARGLPCAVNIAATNSIFLGQMHERFDHELFRVHLSHDIIGVELGGVIKNVIAIATGISDGLQQGANARSAIMTFGLAEIKQVILTLGGQAESVTGLSGIGDLILTCSDDQSRNRRLGLALGKGKSIAEAEAEIGQVVEGKRNAELVMRLADKHDLHLPVCQAVHGILQGKLSTEDGFKQFFYDASTNL